jgi:GIY-YIG catalytic domain
MNKKELIKQYKQTVQPMGVYQIKNLKNGRIFIGSAQDLRGKLNSNRFQLKNGSHFNKELQTDFNEIGEEGFSFEVLDHLKPKEETGIDYKEELKVLEEMWMEKLQPYDGKGYNTPSSKRKPDRKL